MFQGSVDVSPKPDWNPAKLKVAVLIQDAGTMKILGAASIPYQH
jgi:hypothetical protein